MSRKVLVWWDLKDSEGIMRHDVNLPTIVDVPHDVPEEEVSDWLSDRYGWLVDDWDYAKQGESDV